MCTTLTLFFSQVETRRFIIIVLVMVGLVSGEKSAVMFKVFFFCVLHKRSLLYYTGLLNCGPPEEDSNTNCGIRFLTVSWANLDTHAHGPTNKTAGLEAEYGPPSHALTTENSTRSQKSQFGRQC